MRGGGVNSSKHCIYIYKNKKIEQRAEMRLPKYMYICIYMYTVYTNILSVYTPNSSRQRPS